MTPDQSEQWLVEKMVSYYPLEDFKVHPALAEVKI